MLLDKALILKGIAGATSVVGLGGVVVFRKELGLVKDSNAPTGVPDSGGEDKGSREENEDQNPKRAENEKSGSASDPSPGTDSQSQNVGNAGGRGGSNPTTPPAQETDEQKKEKKMKEVNDKLDALGLSDCHLSTTDFTNPTTFSKECDLDQAKFKKIKFSNRGDSQNEVNVEGWSSNNIKLKIENKEQNKIKYTFKDVNSKLTISGDQTKPAITLKANEEREFEEKNSKLGKVPKSSDEASKITALNKKLESIKIPNKCWFEEGESDTSIECDVSNQDVLKKIEFLNKDKGTDSKIVGNTTGLKMTINRLSEQEGALKYSPSSDLEFIFSGYSSEIKIQDNKTEKPASDIVLKVGKKDLFTISQNINNNINTLSKAFIINNLSLKMGLSCTSTHVPCTPSGSDTKIKIFTEEENLEEVTVQKSQENDQIMCVSENVNGFEQGFKYKIKKNFPSTNPKFLKDAEYQAKYVTGKGWGLSKKS